MMYIFTSGRNPFYAVTSAKSKEIRREWTRYGAYIEKLSGFLYEIHDQELLKKEMIERSAGRER